MTSRTWFITGATSGFGRTMTEKLLARGDRVAATARTPERLSDLVEQYSTSLWVSHLDVTDTDELRSVVAKAFVDLGRIDVVVSNAGRGLFGAAEEASDDQLDEQIALNMVAPIQLMRAVLPSFRAQGGGRFVQISSMGGQIVTPGGSLYHASKWGVEGFFEAVMAEVAPFGVEVTIVEPGIARTGFGRSLEVTSALEPYSVAPIGPFRQLIESTPDLTAESLGDPEKMVDAIVASVDRSPAPRRLTLGSDAYELVHQALVGRVGELEDAKEIAFSTDVSH